MGTLRPRKLQEQVLISKCWNLDLSVSSPCTHYNLADAKRCWYQSKTFPRKLYALIEEQGLNRLRPDSGFGIKRSIFRGYGAFQSNEILRIFCRPVDMWIFMFLILWSSLLGKSPRNSEEFGSCMELRRCACSMILQFHEPPVILFLMTWRGKNQSINGYVQEKKKKLSIKRPGQCFQQAENLGLTGSLVNNPKGGPWMRQTLLLWSTRAAEVEAWARWDGEVSCQTCISWGFRELQLIGIHQLSWIQSDLLHLCQCVPSSPECLVGYAAAKGILWLAWKGKQLVEGQALARRFILSFSIGGLKLRHNNCSNISNTQFPFTYIHPEMKRSILKPALSARLLSLSQGGIVLSVILVSLHVFRAIESIRQEEYDPEGPYTLPVPNTKYDSPHCAAKRERPKTHANKSQKVRQKEDSSRYM